MPGSDKQTNTKNKVLKLQNWVTYNVAVLEVCWRTGLGSVDVSSITGKRKQGSRRTWSRCPPDDWSSPWNSLLRKFSCTECLIWRRTQPFVFANLLLACKPPCVSRVGRWLAVYWGRLLNATLFQALDQVCLKTQPLVFFLIMALSVWKVQLACNVVQKRITHETTYQLTWKIPVLSDHLSPLDFLFNETNLENRREKSCMLKGN